MAVLLCGWGWSTAWAVSPTDEAELAKRVRAPAKFLDHAARQEAATDVTTRHALELTELVGWPRTEQQVEVALRQYLQGHPEWLAGVPLGALRTTYRATVPAVGTTPPMVYVQFIQQQEGLDVESSYVHVSVKVLPGRSVVMGADAVLYPNLTLAPAKPTDTKRLRKRATEALGLSPGQVNPAGEQRKLRYIEGRWRRAWAIPATQEGVMIVVDEDTEETWVQDNRLYASVSGRVTGRGVRFNPQTTGQQLDTFPLGDLEVRTATNLSTYTGTFVPTGIGVLFVGTFAFPTQTTPTTLSISLNRGRWAKVSSQASTNLTVNFSVSPGVFANISVNPSDSSEYTVAQVNGYYHTTLIHAWVQARLPLRLAGIDTPLQVNVNIDPASVNPGSACLACYTGGAVPSISFARSGANRVNMAYDTIIYHEYGHFVDDKAGGITSRGLSEGWGDILATYATSQPIIGEAIGTGRTADNTVQYPPGGWGDDSTLGQVWAGFAWHLRANLIASLGYNTGIQTAEQLIIPTFQANAADIPGAVRAVLLRDDNDGTLSNGTPHSREVGNAARQHGIPLPAGI